MSRGIVAVKKNGMSYKVRLNEDVHTLIARLMVDEKGDPDLKAEITLKWTRMNDGEVHS